jgi:hypothetical protein
MQGVAVAHAAFSFAFGSVADIQSFDKWTIVQFWDNKKVSEHKGTKPVDPYIGFYENGQLVLR